ncbi:hypothetical protein QBC40DRAFT_320865 [Triangularia verruculosa]|uniref:Uncharacterized protein n=1 Tax=Triangularia verruculosa TaxID=2587418 RepID=A0AAN6X557_9PEZI|nr:hypothetical protein QBC40DRAFT_320865 [Triangularia verruculosa]
MSSVRRRKAAAKRKSTDVQVIGGDAKRIRTSTGAPSAVPNTRLVHVPVGDGIKTLRMAVDGANDVPDPSTRTLSALERLPGEIRNMVYAYSLVTDESIVPRISGLPPGTAHPPRTGIPAESLLGLALGTNRCISREVLSYFYGMNKFALSLPYHKPWLNRITRRNSACIRAVTLHCEGNDSHSRTYLFEMQNTVGKRCPNLETIDYNCEWFMHSDQKFLERMVVNHMAKTWKQFRRLETINIQHFNLPARLKENSPAWQLLTKLCKQSTVSVLITQRRSQLLEDKAVFEWDKEKGVVAKHVDEERRDLLSRRF